MRSALPLLALLSVSAVAGMQQPHKKAAKFAPKKPRMVARDTEAPKVKRDSTYLTANTAPFAVNGSALPEVNFNVGESYAGTLSIDSNPDNFNRLWFWFFPSENPAASNEITIWLNGGPGCSSLDGLFQENGPFLWQSGTFRPVKNPYAWTNLSMQKSYGML